MEHSDYRLAVASYHSARNKVDKRALQTQIDHIKTDFQTHINNNDPRFKYLSKLRGQKFLLENKAEIGDLFEKINEADITEDIQKLDAQISKIAAELEFIRSAVIYRDAFEWRFEFPEVLDEDGGFLGFDVVLGNPPYIRQEEFSDLKPYLKERFSTFAGTADLLVYFIERSYQILRPEGQFSFIISNKFMRAGFGKALREWLTQRRILEIIDFGDLPVFEEATTYPCILSWQKSTPNEEFQAANVPELHIEDFQSYLPSITFKTHQNALSPSGWTLANANVQQLLEKLKHSGVPLGEYVQGKIYRGVLTGFNEAFVIDEATKDRLITEDPHSADIIKPFLAGRDVKRYQVPKAERYLLFTRRGIDIEQYPAVKAHLAQFRTQLEPRPSDWTGNPHDWPGRKPGSYKWYEIQDSIDYYSEFEKEKIIIPAIVNKPSYTIDNKHHYSNDKTSIIPTSDFALLALLNSKAIDFVLKKISSAKRGGYFEYKPVYVSQLPIVDAPLKIKEDLSEKVKLILADPTADTAALESEIDRLVYTLYGLTEEEIALIEGVA